MIGEADDRTVVERFGRVRRSCGEHVRKNDGLLHKNAPEDPEGGSTSEEDEVAIVKPEVCMAGEHFYGLCRLEPFPRGHDEDRSRVTVVGCPTAFGRAGIVGHGAQARLRENDDGIVTHYRRM